MSQRRPLALLGTLVATLVTLLALAAPAQAEAVTSISANVTVNADTSMRIVETIVYDFGLEDRHGIYRDLAVYDDLASGDRRSYDVSVSSVTMDGQPAQWEPLSEGRYLRVKIGDPDRSIQGQHTYVIDYTVKNGLRVITAEDAAGSGMPADVAKGDVELYWDLIGTAWEVPIGSATGVVVGPAVPLTANCFWGPEGSTSTCDASVSGRTTTLGGIPLQAYEGLTASVVFPRAAFTAGPVENVAAPEIPLGVWTFLGAIPFAGAVLIVPGIIAAFLRRRDKGVDLQADPPQYAPPDGLSPAEMEAVWKGPKSESDPRVLVATLVDLTARGWLALSTTSGLMVTRTAGGSGELRDWERALMDDLVPGSTPVVLDHYDKERTELWHAAYSSLVTQAQESGRRNPLGDRPDQRWNPLAWFAAACFVIGIISIFVGLGAVTAALLPIAFAAFIGFGIARLITPRRETQQSAEFLAKVRGLQRVLATDPAAARREVAQRLGLPPVAVMATMLPFAILFHLESSWMGTFPDLTPADLAMTGFGVASMYDLDTMVSSTNSYAKSATMAPSSGSGGGGFSGGGGGGGGGGSW
jgi:uncharacterized membrane protein YgcG